MTVIQQLFDSYKSESYISDSFRSDGYLRCQPLLAEPLLGTWVSNCCHRFQNYRWSQLSRQLELAELVLSQLLLRMCTATITMCVRVCRGSISITVLVAYSEVMYEP
jgi:hypothetical protein